MRFFFSRNIRKFNKLIDSNIDCSCTFWFQSITDESQVQRQMTKVKEILILFSNFLLVGSGIDAKWLFFIEQTFQFRPSATLLIRFLRVIADTYAFL